MCDPWYSDFSHLVSEWDTSNDRKISDVTRGSNYVARWRCSKGHRWGAAVKSRTVMRSGCPYCSGRKAIPGETDLATLRPDVAAQWSPNNTTSPAETTVTSHQKVEWVCAEGHVWVQTVAARSTGRGCSECARHTARGTDSLASLYPKLAGEWSLDNPVPAERQEVNTYRALWVCGVCGVPWRASITDRVAGRKCPCCSYRKLVTGVNDVRTLHPTIASMSVDTVDFSSVTPRSQVVVRWQCSHGHVFPMSVRYRISRGVDYCPECRVSRLDREPPLSDSHPEVAQMWLPDENGLTPSVVVAGSAKMVLWQGMCGHTWKRSVRSQVKNRSCPICAASKHCARTTPTPPITVTHPVVAAQYSDSNDRAAKDVHSRSSYRAVWSLPCGHTPVIPVKRRIDFPDRCPVCSGKQVVAGVNDLATVHPELAAEWHEDNDRSPSEVTRASGYSAKWAGVCGHVWRAKVSDRSVKGSGCGICSNNTVLAGINDLATTHPAIAAQWHTSNDKSPSEVTAGSNADVVWECAFGHTWKVSPLMRAYRGTGCSVCAGKSVVHGFNDLASVSPELAAEWHPVKNGTKYPDSVTRGSRVKVWWLGACGHEWRATVLNRSNGSGCRRCSKHVSRAESELRAFVEGELPTGTAVHGSDTSVLGGGRELDIYIPSLKLAVEFNGLYWHSDALKAREYHADKTRDAALKGVRVIHVWEDDWRDRRAVVESMLRSRLGTDTRPKLSARSLNHISVTYKQAAEFLDREHIQGSVRGTFYDGLITGGGELVAVLVATKNSSEYRVDRYATSSLVRGGFGKLLKVLENRVREAGGGEIVTFANLDISEGVLYTATGFTHRGTLPPDYMYVYEGSRVHKFNFRKARFRDDPKLIYAPSLTESELSKLNKLNRVYDAGKLRFVKEVH